MHILVTGSSGTIGTRLCERLLAEGHTVTGFDWLPNKWQQSVQAITTIVDIRDGAALEALSNAQSAFDCIIHLAANARVYELVENPERARDNLITLFNMLEFARKNGIHKFIFASSREGYGNLPADKFTEDMVRVENCESPYTASKVGGEALVEAYTRCYNIDHIIFRFSNVYGAYDDSERVVPLFIRKCRANESMVIFGKEKCLDFTYIDDAVSGVSAALAKFDAIKNDRYNLAFGEGTTLIKLAERIKELLKSTSEITYGERRTGEISRYVADISKAQKAFGYAPKDSFDSGIEKAVEWYLANT